MLLDALVPVYTGLYAAAGGGDPLLFALIQFVLVGFFLLPPTICMGATLPLLARFAASTEGETGQQIGRLYGANTIGAVCGVGLAGFFLLPTFGLSTTTIITAAGNVALCAMAAALHVFNEFYDDVSTYNGLMNKRSHGFFGIFIICFEQHKYKIADFFA